MNFCDYDRGKAEGLVSALKNAVSEAQASAEKAISDFQEYVRSVGNEVRAYISGLEARIAECGNRMRDPDADAHAYQYYKAAQDELCNKRWEAEQILHEIDGPYVCDFDEIHGIFRDLSADIDGLVSVIRKEENVMSEVAKIDMAGYNDRIKIRSLHRR